MNNKTNPMITPDKIVGGKTITHAPFSGIGKEFTPIPITFEDLSKIEIYTENSDIPAPPSIPPPPSNTNSIGKTEFWHRNTIGMPIHENNEPYKYLIDYTERVLLGLQVKIKLGNEWEDAIIVGIKETPIIGTQINKREYVLIDLDRLKVRTLFPENICVLKSKIVKTEERIKEINKNPNDIKWEVGDQCLAQFSQDDNWYPGINTKTLAVVYKISPFGAHVYVVYITYNNTECLPVSRLMYIYGNPEKNVQHPEIKGETEIKGESVETGWAVVSERVITEDELEKEKQVMEESRNDVVGDKLKNNDFFKDQDGSIREEGDEALNAYNPLGGNVYKGFDLDQSVQLFETGPKRKLVDGEETVVFKKKKVN